MPSAQSNLINWEAAVQQKKAHDNPIQGAAGAPVLQLNTVPQGTVDAIAYAIACICTSVEVNNQTVETKEKQEVNLDSVENNMIDNEQKLRFKTLSKSMLYTKQDWWDSAKGFYVKWVAKSSQQKILEGVETTNMEVSAQRDYWEDKLTNTRQNSQLGDTDTSTAANEGMQSLQAGGALMTMLVTLTNQIVRI